MSIQVGIIGYGMSASIFHAPIITRVAGLNLQAIVSSDEQKVHRDYPALTVYPDTTSLLACPDIDLVVITTPNTTHYALTKQALLAGKHVVVEKPFTNSVTEADELIALARTQNKLLSVYHNRRFDGDFLTVQHLLATNILGTLSTYESHFDRFRPSVLQRWREKDLPGSGTLYDLGSHLIDQALVLFGKPQTVYADLRNERDGAATTDYFHLVLTYSTQRVILHSSALTAIPGPRFTLHGTKGSFVKYGLDPQEKQLTAGLKPGDANWGIEPPDKWGTLSQPLEPLSMTGTITTVPGCYQRFYNELAAALKTAAPLPVTAEQARDVIYIIECARQSFQEQRVIEVK